MRYKTPDEIHSGWRNRETWIVALAIANEEGVYERYRELALNAPGLREAADLIASAFRTSLDESVQNAKPFIPDLLNCAAMRVDWTALAERLRRPL